MADGTSSSPTSSSLDSTSDEDSTPTSAPAEGPAAGLKQLLALQDEDILIDQLRHRRAHLPEQATLRAIDARLDGLARDRAKVDAERAILSGRESELERETSEVVARIAAIEERGRTGSAGYRDQEAMAVEVASLGARRAELEDHELEVLELSEPLDAEIERLDGARAELTADREAASTALEAAVQAVEEELARALARRGPIEHEVPALMLSEYERIRGRLDGVGVARLVRGTCSGCHLTLPAIEVDRLQRAPKDSIAHCEQCGRILVP